MPLIRGLKERIMRAEKKDRAGARNSGGNGEERDGGDAVEDARERGRQKEKRKKKRGFPSGRRDC